VTRVKQAHSSIKRALIVAGIPLVNFRPLATDASQHWAMDPRALEQAIEVRACLPLIT
jgi:glutamate/tyrosine decarboxylase-like PLP-dependent enzyme